MSTFLGTPPARIFLLSRRTMFEILAGMIAVATIVVLAVSLYAAVTATTAVPNYPIDPMLNCYPTKLLHPC